MKMGVCDVSRAADVDWDSIHLCSGVSAEAGRRRRRRRQLLDPGTFGSLAAAPQQPGWSFTTFFYNANVKVGADVAFARQVHRGLCSGLR